MRSPSSASSVSSVSEWCLFQYDHLRSGTKSISIDHVWIQSTPTSRDDIDAPTQFTGITEDNEIVIMDPADWGDHSLRWSGQIAVEDTEVQFGIDIPMGTLPLAFTAPLTVELKSV